MNIVSRKSLVIFVMAGCCFFAHTFGMQGQNAVRLANTSKYMISNYWKEFANTPIDQQAALGKETLSTYKEYLTRFGIDKQMSVFNELLVWFCGEIKYDGPEANLPTTPHVESIKPKAKEESSE